MTIETAWLLENFYDKSPHSSEHLDSKTLKANESMYLQIQTRKWGNFLPRFSFLAEYVRRKQTRNRNYIQENVILKKWAQEYCSSPGLAIDQICPRVIYCFLSIFQRIYVAPLALSSHRQPPPSFMLLFVREPFKSYSLSKIFIHLRRFRHPFFFFVLRLNPANYTMTTLSIRLPSLHFQLELPTTINSTVGLCASRQMNIKRIFFRCINQLDEAISASK